MESLSYFIVSLKKTKYEKLYLLKMYSSLDEPNMFSFP